ncbi:MAG: tRNA pseudouridine(55) synthase TruB [Ruminococcus sp.]|nr:tRNA pseudouridine(55) synthase TruB [Ruminococcus sp.]
MSEQTELCGVLPVFKPEGWTSFDVIAKLRGILHIRRLGHAGTLDPMATGVLPVFVGKATKACDILPDSDKAYEAGFRLGLSTDTQDITGKVITECGDKVSEALVLTALEGFRGEIMQLPPMYSAVKVGGQRLYDLARQGKEVEREPRRITVYKAELTEYNESTREGRLYISCSKGTYIRTIIHDLGAALSCGGAMTSLCRVSAAGFDLEDCFTMEQLGEIPLETALRPLLTVFEGYTRVRLDEHCTAMYKNGVKLGCEQVGISRSYDKDFCVIGCGGGLLGLARVVPAEGVVRAVKNFY